MQKNVDFLEDINAKYSSQECELELRLKKILLEEQQFEAAEAAAAKKVTFDEDPNRPRSCKNLQEARERNAELIKDLEMSKARLRSRATYSPLEMELNKAIARYNGQRSLTPMVLGEPATKATTTTTTTTTRKVYGPTFV